MDRKTGKLVESRPKVLYEQMPVIYIYAINTTAGKDSKLYECPIYRKPARSVCILMYPTRRIRTVGKKFNCDSTPLLQDGLELHRIHRFRKRHRSKTLDHERRRIALRHKVTAPFTNYATKR